MNAAFLMQSSAQRFWQLARTAFHWWIGELKASVPPRLAKAFRPRSQQILIDFDHDLNPVTCRIEGPEAAWQAFDESALGAGRVSPLRSLVLGPLRRDVVVRLPPSRALSTILAFPAACEPDLRNILKLDLDRQTPFSPANAVFDYRICERGENERQIVVELVVLPRRTLGAVIERLDERGQCPSRIGLAEEDAPASVSFDFLGDEQHQAGLPDKWRPIRRAALLALIFGGACATYFWVDFQRDELAALEQRLQAARREAALVDRLRKEADGLEAKLGFLAARRTTPFALETIDGLTRLIPDDAWIYDLQVNGTQGRIAGFAEAAPSLIGLFEASDRFASARFRAPVTRDQRRGMDRFDLAFELKPRTVP